MAIKKNVVLWAVFTVIFALMEKSYSQVIYHYGGLKFAVVTLEVSRSKSPFDPLKNVNEKNLFTQVKSSGVSVREQFDPQLKTDMHTYCDEDIWEFTKTGNEFISNATTDKSEDQSFLSLPSGFIGVVINYNGFNAKFNKSYQNKIDGEFAAKLPGCFGIGAIVGYSQRLLGFEICYTRASANMTFATGNNENISGKVTCNIVNMDLKLHLMLKPPIRPFLLVGIGVIWLTPENEYLYGTPLSHGTFSMLNFDCGGGFEQYLASAISITGRVIYQIFDGVVSIGSLSGKHPVITYHLWGNRLNFDVSAQLHF